MKFIKYENYTIDGYIAQMRNLPEVVHRMIIVSKNIIDYVYRL